MAVSDRLLGIERAEFSEDWARRNVPEYEAACALHTRPGSELPAMARMGADLAASGGAGLAQALHNGPDEAENQELLYCTDPQRIAGLVLSGLGRL